jgi:hypothetical protein
MRSKRVKEIRDFMLTELDNMGAEATDENQFYFLTGLRDAWIEDQDNNLEKSLYQLALAGEMARIEAKLRQKGLQP